MLSAAIIRDDAHYRVMCINGRETGRVLKCATARRSSGSAFHAEGPANENARSPNIRGTIKKFSNEPVNQLVNKMAKINGWVRISKYSLVINFSKNVYSFSVYDVIVSKLTSCKRGNSESLIACSYKVFLLKAVQHQLSINVWLLCLANLIQLFFQ